MLDEAAARIARDAAEPVDPATLEKAAVEGMLDALGDRWSTYYGPADFSAYNASLEGRYTGVGVWLRQRLDGAVLVASVQGATPAAAAGVQPGDQLVAVDGRSTEDQSVSEVARLLRGEEGVAVRLTLTTTAGDTRDREPHPGLGDQRRRDRRPARGRRPAGQGHCVHPWCRPAGPRRDRRRRQHQR